MNDELSRAFENLPPELIKQIIALGGLGEQGDILNEQIAQAQAIRNQAAPQGRQAGRVYMAANPLEHAGNAFQKFRANRQLKDLRAQQQGLIKQQTAGREGYANALLHGGGGDQAPLGNDYQQYLDQFNQIRKQRNAGYSL